MVKAPRPEVEYFGKIDIHRIKKLAETKRERIAKDEMQRLKKLHRHRCASCGMELEQIPFKGTDIHKCFNCGGVFLESGTLEKICGEESHFIQTFIELFKF